MCLAVSRFFNWADTSSARFSLQAIDLTQLNIVSIDQTYTGDTFELRLGDSVPER